MTIPYLLSMCASVEEATAILSVLLLQSGLSCAAMERSFSILMPASDEVRQLHRILLWYHSQTIVLIAITSAGIGTMMTGHGLSIRNLLRKSGAAGCAVLGDRDDYSRFGFSCDHALYYRGVPAHYVQALALSDSRPAGEVTYHEGFAAA